MSSDFEKFFNQRTLKIIDMYSEGFKISTKYEKIKNLLKNNTRYKINNYFIHLILANQRLFV